MTLVLSSGRTLRIEKLIIAHTVHSGILAGHPIRIAQKIRERLRETIIAECPCPERVIENMLILDDGELTLPPYRIIADLMSTPITPDDNGWCSELLACWFTDTIAMSPAELITTKITDELWQQHAVDFSFDDI